jgi:hypothetical protein
MSSCGAFRCMFFRQDSCVSGITASWRIAIALRSSRLLATIRRQSKLLPKRIGLVRSVPVQCSSSNGCLLYRSDSFKQNRGSCLIPRKLNRLSSTSNAAAMRTAEVRPWAEHRLLVTDSAAMKPPQLLASPHRIAPFLVVHTPVWDCLGCATVRPKAVV